MPYWIMMIYFTPIFFITLTWLYWKRRNLFTHVLNDVRLYLDRKSRIACETNYRIDKAVGRDFLQLIGLDWDFRPLQKHELVSIQGENVVFTRVVWIAHSMGTVISYNVLSDLLEKSNDMLKTGDEIQRLGAEKVRNAVTSFITIGSPLNDIALWYGSRTLRFWPTDWLAEKESWWLNFFHELDPISGPVTSHMFGNQKPRNILMRSGILPGIVHLRYWKDRTILETILAQVKDLPNKTNIKELPKFICYIRYYFFGRMLFPLLIYIFFCGVLFFLLLVFKLIY